MDKAGLLAYVNQKLDDLHLMIHTGCPSIQYLTPMYKVRGDTALNNVETTVKFHEAGCEFINDNGTKLSQRVMHAKALEFGDIYCLTDFINTYMQDDLAMRAGYEKLPFADKFVEEVKAATLEALETEIWQGGILDGFKSFASEYNTFTPSTEATNVYKILRELKKVLPTKVIRNEPIVYLGDDMYCEFLDNLQDAGVTMVTNPATELGMPDEAEIPFSRHIKVVGLPGLAGTGEIYATYKKNLYYGTDIESEIEGMPNENNVAKMIYDEKNNRYLMIVRFISGVAVRYPQLVWYYKRSE